MNRRQQGFSLVEVTMALGIATFALVAIFSLLPVGIGSNDASIRQTEVINLATGIVADLRQIPPGNGSVSPRYKVDPGLSSATFYVDRAGEPVPQAKAAYKAKIALAAPESGQRSATRGSVELSWPAAASEPANSVSFFVGLDRN